MFRRKLHKVRRHRLLYDDQRNTEALLLHLRQMQYLSWPRVSEVRCLRRHRPLQSLRRPWFAINPANIQRRTLCIPTFDSGGWEWDSRILEFLIFDGQALSLVVLRGGYYIAHLAFYETLLSADCCLKTYFDKIGWPTKGINWQEEI